MSRMIVIKSDMEISKVSLVRFFDLCDQLFWLNTQLLRFEHNRRTMCIISTHIVTFVTAEFLKTNPNICLDIPQHVADMDWAVGVGKRISNQYFSHCCWHVRFHSFDVTESLEVYLDRKSTRLNSSHVRTSYAVFCLK